MVGIAVSGNGLVGLTVAALCITGLNELRKQKIEISHATLTLCFFRWLTLHHFLPGYHSVLSLFCPGLSWFHHLSLLTSTINRFAISPCWLPWSGSFGITSGWNRVIKFLKKKPHEQFIYHLSEVEVIWERQGAHGKPGAFGIAVVLMLEAAAVEESPPLLSVIAEWETSCACDIRAPLQLNKHIKGLHQIVKSRTTWSNSLGCCHSALIDMNKSYLQKYIQLKWVFLESLRIASWKGRKFCLLPAPPPPLRLPPLLKSLMHG